LQYLHLIWVNGAAAPVEVSPAFAAADLAMGARPAN
jgi:hypothetical protein